MFFFFKQKTAYEMRISDWSSDVCSSDLSASCSARSITEHQSWRSAPDSDVSPTPGERWAGEHWAGEHWVGEHWAGERRESGTPRGEPRSKHNSGRASGSC